MFVSGNIWTVWAQGFEMSVVVDVCKMDVCCLTFRTGEKKNKYGIGCWFALNQSYPLKDWLYQSTDWKVTQKCGSHLESCSGPNGFPLYQVMVRPFHTFAFSIFYDVPFYVEGKQKITNNPKRSHWSCLSSLWERNTNCQRNHDK